MQFLPGTVAEVQQRAVPDAVRAGGTISCDDFKLTEAGSDENLIENGDFAKESILIM